MTTRTTATLASVALAAGIFIGWAIPRTPATPSHVEGPAQTQSDPPATQSAAAVEEWPVLRIVDGDTAIVRWQSSQPADERGRPGYREATAALQDLLAGGKVRLQFEEPGDVKRDNFGRLLV